MAAPESVKAKAAIARREAAPPDLQRDVMEFLLLIQRSFPPAARYAAIMAETGFETGKKFDRRKNERCVVDGFAFERAFLA